MKPHMGPCLLPLVAIRTTGGYAKPPSVCSPESPQHLWQAAFILDTRVSLVSIISGCSGGQITMKGASREGGEGRGGMMVFQRRDAAGHWPWRTWPKWGVGPVVLQVPGSVFLDPQAKERVQKCLRCRLTRCLVPCSSMANSISRSPDGSF